MALTTAERQRRFRARRASEIVELKAQVAKLEKANRALREEARRLRIAGPELASFRISSGFPRTC
jgi:hypothetical protein